MRSEIPSDLNEIFRLENEQVIRKVDDQLMALFSLNQFSSILGT